MLELRCSAAQVSQVARQRLHGAEGLEALKLRGLGQSSSETCLIPLKCCRTPCHKLSAEEGGIVPMSQSMAFNVVRPAWCALPSVRWEALRPSRKEHERSPVALYGRRLVQEMISKLGLGGAQSEAGLAHK